MNISHKIIFVLLTSLCQSANAFVSQNSHNDIDQLIVLTDQLKVTNGELFKENLKKLKLKSEVENLNAEQREYIAYLSAYESVLKGEHNQAKVLLEDLYARATSLQVKAIVKATTANLQAVSQEYSDALINLDVAIKLAEKINRVELAGRIYLVSALVYNILNIWDLSLKYTDLIIESQTDEPLLCKAQAVNLRAKLNLGEDVPQQKVHDIIQFCTVLNLTSYANSLKLDWLHLELVNAYEGFNSELVSSLLELVKQSSESIEASGQNNLIGLKDMVLAKAYFYHGDVEIAVQIAHKVIDGSKNSGNTTQLQEALKILLIDAKTREDYKTALEISEQLSRVENEIYADDKAKQLAYMTVKHDMLARDLEIKQLNQNNQVLALENKLAVEVSRKQQLLVALASVLLILLALWAFSIKRKHDYFKNISEIDHLTQVFSRKAFEERMHKLISTSKNSQTHLNLAILDLDFFKSINDRFGHSVGDVVLQKVVAVCEEEADEDVIVARLGGEEFVIVSPDVTFEKFVQLMERMRLAIEETEFAETGHEFNLTASFGVTDSKRSGLELSTLLADADDALFKAKNNGRNQVKTFQV